MQDAAGSPSLRARIEARLRGTEPGVDFEFPYESQLTAEQFASLRSYLPKELERAAVLVPIVERPQGLQVLLTQRASHLKNHAGQVSFPGGRIESADVGPWQAALREAQEEIGLQPEYVSLVGYLPDHLVITGFRVTPVVAFVRPGFTLHLDATEVEAAFEVPLEFLLEPANRRPRERSFGGLTFTTWDVTWEQRQIWGATANMLLSLGKLLEASVP